jgi:hypothetical protein
MVMVCVKVGTTLKTLWAVLKRRDQSGWCDPSWVIMNVDLVVCPRLPSELGVPRPRVARAPFVPNGHVRANTLASLSTIYHPCSNVIQYVIRVRGEMMCFLYSAPR